MFNRRILFLLMLLASGMAMTAMSGTVRGAPMPEAQFDEGIEGAHDMKGTVTAVDKRSGLVELSLGAMSLTLHFPPPTLLDVDEGDTLIFRIGIKEVQHNKAATEG